MLFRTALLRTAVTLAIAPVALAGQAQLTGAGASFPNPIYQKWFSEYQKAHPGVTINYQSVGSGAGIRQITEGTVDFGASDGPMTDQQIADFKAKRGTDILHFPTVLGAVVPIYNLPGVSASLKFTPEAIAGIYLGTITKWNDKAIAGANPGVTLPATDIVVVHRSDGSGTTYCFTDYLSKVSAEWKSKVGTSTSVNWPVGLGGAQNPGVAGLVKQTPGAIGYVELIYAMQNNISYGSVKNQAGAFVTASLAGVSAAAAGAAATMPADFRVSITNAPGKDAYPISTFTWLLVPAKFKDAAKQKVMVEFLRWMVGPAQQLTEALAYAPLPKPVVNKEMKAIGMVK
ncbi:MAG TPA: phosphate ABC transporter substrate-binding protein PstS [Gemmatimonadaceae bacterium]|nr:phosphate ABC transporter substrate-binding protein PstS [Gemmatimonadaceae bacterium]